MLLVSVIVIVKYIDNPYPINNHAKLGWLKLTNFYQFLFNLFEST